MPVDDKDLEKIDKLESHQLDNWYGFPHGPNSLKGALIAFIGLIAIIVGIYYIISVI